MARIAGSFHRVLVRVKQQDYAEQDAVAGDPVDNGAIPISLNHRFTSRSSAPEWIMFVDEQ